MKHWSGWIFLLFLFLVRAGRPEAGEGEPAIRPVRQPLLVARMKGAETLSRLMETRQARTLGAAERDYSGTVPGLGARLTSLRGLMAGLAEKGVDAAWYGLGGTSILTAVAAFGADWEAGVDAGELRSWLDGFFPGHAFALDTTSLSPRGSRWIAAADAPALRENVGGGASAGESWRRDLDRFMADDAETLGFWLDPRPFIGLVSLTADVDLRSKAARLGLNLPESAALRLLPGLDMGLVLRLARVFPHPWPMTDDHRLWIDRGDRSLLRLSVPAPLALAERLGFQPPLFLANLNLRDLSPRVSTLDLWRNADTGALEWTLVNLMPDAGRFRKQWRRVNAILDLMALSRATGLTVSDLPGSEPPRRRYAWKDFICEAGIVEDGDGRAYLVATSGDGPFPLAGDLVVREADEPFLAAWRFALDYHGAAMAAERLEELLGRRGLHSVDPAVLRALVRHGDSGALTVNGDAVVFTSERGYTPFVFAALTAELAAGLE